MNTSAGMEPLIDFRDVSKDYPPETHALKSATFSLASGESVAVVGPSGSGKSTLLAILGLLDSPSDGDYRIMGQHVGNADPKRRAELRKGLIGFIFQAFHLIPHLTAVENVRFGLEVKGFGRRASADRADRYLELVGLAHRMDAFPATLSGGEQQRVAIARALAPEPRLLLCDEPTGNLDSATSASVLELLHRAAGADSALVIVTHDESVAATCSRRLLVRDGRVSERP